MEKLSFEDAINSEKERTKGEFERMLKDENYYSKDYFHYSYLDRGIYVTKLKSWMNIFPKEQFLILQSEEFFKEPNKLYNQVLKFLDLPKWQLKEYKKIGAGSYKHSEINLELRKKFIEYFKPYNEQLFEFLGTKFDWDK